MVLRANGEVLSIYRSFGIITKLMVLRANGEVLSIYHASQAFVILL